MKNINVLIIEELSKSRQKNPAVLNLLKRKMSKKHKIPFPSNVSLLKTYHKMVKNKRIKKEEALERLLRKRPIRSLSGIVNVAVLTKPYPCPGKCLYCPNQAGAPKSYLKNEPAVMRAILNKYNPYLQVQTRLKSLRATGHPTDKIELRIIGGTWSYYPKQYQTWFIKRCFQACNEFPNQKKTKKQTLESVLKENEKAKNRIIGLSIETRPDFINVSEIKRLRKLGVTMVELGVQTIYDDILKLNKRGHGIKETISATKILRDAGFKVLYQMMVNLPGSDLKKDEKMFEELFSNPPASTRRRGETGNFQPDLLKIYPCAVLKESQLYRWWKKGKYQPYREKELIDLIKKIKKKIPYYVRIQRITRDIPADSIAAGPAKISNLRQIITKEAKEEDWHCKCIRCREVREKYNPREKIYLFRQDYFASGAREIFLSFENKNRTKLFSLLRLRMSCQPIFSVLKNSTIIREIHTYGKLVSIGSQKLAPQHQGLGKKLIKEAEKISKKEFGLRKIAVIAGVGARNYFRKQDYRLEKTYMVKKV